MVGHPDSPEYLYHFTGRPRGSDPPPFGTASTAEGRLAQMLHEGALKAWKVFGTSYPALCFSELSNAALRTQFTTGFTGRGRYEPWGLILRKRELINVGVRPVWYMNGDELAATQALPSEMRDRRVRFDPLNPAGAVDWTHEREWRLCFGPRLPAELPLTRSMVVGIFVGSRDWNPNPDLPPTARMYQVSRYWWDGHHIRNNLWLGNFYRIGLGWGIEGELDWSGDEPFVPPEPPEPVWTDDEPPDPY